MNNGFVPEGWSISSPSVREKLCQRSGCQEELRHRNCTRSLLDDVSPRAGSRSILEERERDCWRMGAGGEEDGVMEQDIYSVCPEGYNGNLMRRTHKVRGLV